MVATIKMGDVTDFRTFMGAVIDQGAFDSISGYIDRARSKAPRARPRSSPAASATTRKGYFIEPTVIEANDPHVRDHGGGDLRPGADDPRLPGEGPAEDPAPVRQVHRPTP